MKLNIIIGRLNFQEPGVEVAMLTLALRNHTRQNDILGSRLIACCKLAPTFARQMRRHNDVIDRNEYLISTLAESAIP